jgi:hypothetical protein
MCIAYVISIILVLKGKRANELTKLAQTHTPPSRKKTRERGEGVRPYIKAQLIGPSLGYKPGLKGVPMRAVHCIAL